MSSLLAIFSLPKYEILHKSLVFVAEFLYPGDFLSAFYFWEMAGWLAGWLAGLLVQGQT
jgi:hypothetical protein